MEAGGGGDGEPGAGGDQLPPPRHVQGVQPLLRQQGRAASPRPPPARGGPGQRGRGLGHQHHALHAAARAQDHAHRGIRRRESGHRE